LATSPTSRANRAKIHTELASLYFERGNMSVALEALRTAIAADPNYALAHGMFGLVYMELKEVKLAEESFGRGLSLAPQDPDLNHNYGWFLCQTQREKDSIKYFMQAIRNPLYATPGRSFAAAGICSLRQNEIKDAEQYFLRALQIDAHDPSSLLQLGQIRYRQNNFEDARQLVTRFNKLVEPTPNRCGSPCASSAGSASASPKRALPGSCAGATPARANTSCCSAASSTENAAAIQRLRAARGFRARDREGSATAGARSAFRSTTSRSS
jgi:type IV pilus assembly protein PilF